MTKAHEIRCFDYVNHPYDEVSATLTDNAPAVFQKATKIAASRARAVASELHAKVAGIEVQADVSISVKLIEDHPRSATSPPVTRIHLEWEAATLPRLFPFMRAELAIYPLTPTETQLDFSGHYQPPFGVLGDLLDAVAGHRIAEASVHRFVTDVAGYLKATL